LTLFISFNIIGVELQITFVGKVIRLRFSVLLFFSAFGAALIVLVACNEDAATAFEAEPRPATGSFLVTGTVNRSVNGDASFQIETVHNRSTLEIVIFDDFIDEFQLDFFLTYEGDGQIPGTGTYTIGGDPEDQNKFRAYLTFFGSGFGDGIMFSTDYLDDAGVLNITESTVDRISGTFQFEAQTFALPGDEPARIAIQDGEFSAIAQ
jgi:hypothetical protein